MRKSEAYRVEVCAYVGERRRVVVWRRGPDGPWIIWGSLPLPDDKLADSVIEEVWKRLPEPVARDATDRVYLKLAAGLGR